MIVFFFLHLCKRQKWNRRLRCTLLWSINIVKCVKSSTKGSWLNAHGETYSICLWIIRPLAAKALHTEKCLRPRLPIQRALRNAPRESTEPRPQVHLQHRFTVGFITVTVDASIHARISHTNKLHGWLYTIAFSRYVYLLDYNNIKPTWENESIFSELKWHMQSKFPYICVKIFNLFSKVPLYY